MKRNLYNAVLLLLTSIALLSCKKEKEYVINKGLNPNDIIKITSIQPTIGLADSNSKIILRVQINKHTDSATTVVLTTSSGLINSKSKSEAMRVNVNRYVDFVLTSGNTSGPVSIRAAVMGTFFSDTLINFTKSYPDTILVYPEAYTIAMNSSVAASIQLIKNTGYPSQNQTIFLSALDAEGNNLGRFTYSGAYSPGTAISASFNPPVDYVGKIMLQTTVIKEDGSKIVGKNTIDIQ